MEDLEKKLDEAVEAVEEECSLDDNELEDVAGGKFVIKKPAKSK